MVTPTIPQSVLEVMSSRTTRMHHYLWHMLRENWNNPVITENDRRELTNILGEEWDLKNIHPAFRYEADLNGDHRESKRFPAHDISGEDFFFMHRQMINSVNKLDPKWRVEGWKTMPSPNDPDYPIINYETPYQDINDYLDKVKTNKFFHEEIEPRDRLFKEKILLQNMSLGELGSRIEMSIHNWIHLRISRISSHKDGIRPPEPSDQPIDLGVDPKWDDPSYDWMADQYSSHVNPIFWKLHGWVDDRINDWKMANLNNPDRVENGEVKWSKNLWVGAQGGHALREDSAPDPHHLHHMQKAIVFLHRKGCFSKLYQSTEMDTRAELEKLAAVRPQDVPSPTEKQTKTATYASYCVIS